MANRILRFSWICVALLVGMGSQVWALNKSSSIHQQSTSSSRALLFEQNKGQFDSKVSYLARGHGYAIALGIHPVVELFRYQSVPELGPSVLPDEERKVFQKIVDSKVFRMTIVGANEQAQPKTYSEPRSKTNYLRGEKSTWMTNISNFERVRYESILNNIDIDYYGNDGRLEYDFIIHPGADTADIQLKYEGIDKITISEDGGLLIQMDERSITQQAPISYQLDAAGNKHPIQSSYTLESGIVGFQVASYNSEKDLIIDPVLEYSRYYGGSNNDHVAVLAIDGEDNLYAIGESASPELATLAVFQNETKNRTELIRFPRCSGSLGQDPNTGRVRRVGIIPPEAESIFITKFSVDGERVIWPTFISADEEALIPDYTKTINIVGNSAAVSSQGEVAF